MQNVWYVINVQLMVAVNLLYCWNNTSNCIHILTARSHPFLPFQEHYSSSCLSSDPHRQLHPPAVSSTQAYRQPGVSTSSERKLSPPPKSLPIAIPLCFYLFIHLFICSPLKDNSLKELSTFAVANYSLSFSSTHSRLAFSHNCFSKKVLVNVTSELYSAKSRCQFSVLLLLDLLWVFDIVWPPPRNFPFLKLGFLLFLWLLSQSLKLFCEF